MAAAASAATTALPSYTIQLQTESGSGYVAHVIRAQDPNLIQPFGALGGMPSLARLIMVQLTMGRLPPAYVFTSVQNSQLLVFTTNACIQKPEEDHALFTILAGHCVDAVHAGVVERATAIPGYTAALDAHKADAQPAWRTSNTSGTYGVLYHRNFEYEYTLQQRACAVEEAYLRLGDSDKTSAPTHVLGMCTMAVEKCSTPSYVRFLTAAEVRAGIAWSAKAWDKEISSELRSRVPASLAGTDEAALSHALLEARASMEQTAMGQRQAHANEQLSALFRPATASNETAELDQFLHITAVVGHPGAPGAGSCALDKACEIADASQLPLVLEALPFRLLFAYYARWGFRPVVWLGSKPDTPRNFNPKMNILMYREPVRKAEEDQPASETDKTECDVRDMLPVLRYAESEDARTMTTELLRRPFSITRTNLRPEELHLSVETETGVYPSFVWSKVSGGSDVYVDLAYSWAREYARQVRAGEWGTLPLRIPIPDPVPPLPPGASPPSPSSSSSGSTTSSSAGAGMRRSRPAQPATSSSPQPVSGQDDDPPRPPAQRARTDAASSLQLYRPAMSEKAIQTSPARPMAVHATGVSMGGTGGAPFNLIFNVHAGGIVYVNYPPPQLQQA